MVNDMMSSEDNASGDDSLLILCSGIAQLSVNSSKFITRPKNKGQALLQMKKRVVGSCVLAISL